MLRSLNWRRKRSPYFTKRLQSTSTIPTWDKHLYQLFPKHPHNISAPPMTNSGKSMKLILSNILPANTIRDNGEFSGTEVVPDIREIALCDFIHADKVIVIGNCHKNPELIPKKLNSKQHLIRLIFKKTESEKKI